MSSARSFGAGQLAAGAGALALVASGLAARALAVATPQAVYFRGGELGMACAVREQFGVPCPACGLTRSVLLTLHGLWREALAVNPGGPLVVLGVAALGCLLVAASLRSFTRGRPWPDDVFRKAALAASAYGGVVTAVLLGHWLRALV